MDLGSVMRGIEAITKVIIMKTLLKTTLLRRFRLQCCLSLQEPANHSITSFLNWLPVLYIVNAKAPKEPAQMGQDSVVPMA